MDSDTPTQSSVIKQIAGALICICQDLDWGYGLKIARQLGVEDVRLIKFFGLWYCAVNYTTRGYRTDYSHRDPQLPFGASVLKWWNDFEEWINDQGGLQQAVLMYTESYGQAFTDYMENTNPPDSLARRINNEPTHYTKKMEKSLPDRQQRVQDLWEGIE